LPAARGVESLTPCCCSGGGGAAARAIVLAMPRNLATGGFILPQCNSVLIGGTGAGKSHLAIAIARSCISACISGGMANECARRKAMIPGRDSGSSAGAD